MDASQITVLLGGIALIGGILWYFFGERTAAIAERREGGV